jgi:hypothetical protein
MAYFSDYPGNERAALVKRELMALIKSIFEQPEKLKAYIEQGRLSNEQCKPMLAAINDFNTSTCVCCRKFNQGKIKLNPISVELDPLLDIALEIAKQKHY